MTLTTRQSGTLEMAAAMILSGTLGYFVFEAGQSVWNIVFFRCVFAAISLGLYCWWRGFLSPWPLHGKTLLLALVAGATLVSNWVLLFSAYGYASISVSTAVYHTQPFFLLLAANVFFGERIGLGKLPWFLTAFVGLLLVVELSAAEFNGGSEQLIGFSMALGAAILYAVTTLLTKRLVGIRPHIIALVHVALGVVMLAPFVNYSELPAMPIQWSHLITLGVVHTCIMYIFLYSAFQKLPIVIIAILAFLYPAVAILVDYLIYDQDLSLMQWLGMTIIMLSATAINTGLTIRLPKFVVAGVKR